MHPALLGALVGLGIAVVMYAVDYMQLSSAASERAKRLGKKSSEFSGEDRKHMRAVGSFCLVLPPALALVFWIGSKIFE